MARKKTPAQTGTETKVEVAAAPKPSFAIGDLVFIKGGAVDVNDKPISAMYAGVNNPLRIQNIVGKQYILAKGTAIVYTVTATAISAEFKSR